MTGDEAIDYPRLGFLYADYPADLRVPALLWVSPETGIRIDLPFTGDDLDQQPHVAWFRKRDRQSCPDEVAFRDPLLDVHLLGVSVTGFTGSPGWGPGVGYLRASLAVEDADHSAVSFGTIHEMRTEPDLVHAFAGLRTSTIEHTTAEDGHTRELRIKSVHQEPIHVGEFHGIDTYLHPVWFGGQTSIRDSEITERTWIRTQSRGPRPINDHAQIHERVKDLLALVCWSPVAFRDAEVKREDAPAGQGRFRHTPWRRLHSPAFDRTPSTEGFDSFVATLSPARLSDIGPHGIQAWVQADASLRRVTDPLLTLLYTETPTPELSLMQSSIAAEALGYRLSVSAGSTEKAAAGESFAERLARILDLSPLPVREMFDDLNAWIRVTADAYNGLKHANRPVPERAVAFTLAETLICLVQAQVVLELGVETEAAQEYKKQQRWWGLRDNYERLLGEISAPRG